MYEHEKFFKSRRTKVTPATCVEGIARGSRSRSQQGHGSALRRSLSHRFCSEKRPAVVHQCRAAPAPRWPHPETQAPGSTRGVPRASRTRHAALPRESAGSGPGNSPQKKALDSPRECERQSGHPATALPGAWLRPQGHGPLPPGITAGDPLPEIKRQPMPGFPRRHASVPAHAKAESGTSSHDKGSRLRARASTCGTCRR